MRSIRVVCFSDTHTYHDEVEIPEGDIAVHAGDATSRGYKHELQAFGKWYGDLPYLHKIFVAGNHDTSFEDTPAQALTWLNTHETFDEDGVAHTHRNGAITYLQDSSVELEVNGIKLKIYGSPWQPEFCSWGFNLPRGEALKQKWDMIPKDTDILVTHSPAYKLRDRCAHGEHVGCRELKQALQRVKPKLHVFGHIHEERGVEVWNNIQIANASSCNRNYQPVNKPLVLEIFEDGSVCEV